MYHCRCVVTVKEGVPYKEWEWRRNDLMLSEIMSNCFPCIFHGSSFVVLFYFILFYFLLCAQMVVCTGKSWQSECPTCNQEEWVCKHKVTLNGKQPTGPGFKAIRSSTTSDLNPYLSALSAQWRKNKFLFFKHFHGQYKKHMKKLMSLASE